MTTSTPDLPNSGSNATTSPLKIDVFALALGALALISSCLPIPSVFISVSTFSPPGSVIRTVAESGSAMVSRTRTSASRSRYFGVELRARDEDADARDVLLGVGHQPSSLGRLSARPRRRWSGFSMLLASAIERQTVASP